MRYLKNTSFFFYAMLETILLFEDAFRSLHHISFLLNPGRLIQVSSTGSGLKPNKILSIHNPDLTTGVIYNA
jgi:hypothetical protein